MKPEDIKLSDWIRILFGEIPAGFYIEIVIRTIIMFVLLVVSMRIFGKRMAAQISRLEVTALFSLAAAVGVPLQAPDRGVLPAVIIALVVVGVGRIIAALAFRQERFETKVEGFTQSLVNDGVLDVKRLALTTVSTLRVFAQLRSVGIRHLGEVKRFYLEANGTFSVVRYDYPDYGLSILPPFDYEFFQEQKLSDQQVCSKCGNRKTDNPNSKICINCGKSDWEIAIIG